MASPPGACRWGDGDKRNNLLCVLTPGGGHNLGCVAPSPAGLTYGQGSTRGNNGLAPPPPLPVSIRAAPALALFSCPQGEPPVHGDSLTSNASSSCRLKPGKTNGLGVSVPARKGTPARCIARTSPADLRYQPFIEAAASGAGFCDQNELKLGGMYLTRGSAVNWGSSRLAMARRTVRVGTCQVPLRTKRA